MAGPRRAALASPSPAGQRSLAAATCAAQLARLRALAGPPPDPEVDWSIARRAGEAEVTVQAESGLMHVHGLRWGGPRRIGLDVASVAAGLLAAQGVVAAVIARRRGLAVRSVEVPALAGGLVFLRHHLAIATCADPWRPPAVTGAGTPLACADGAWVELEALTFESWAAFWRLLGVETGLEEAWAGFVFRFLSGRCGLPAALHRAAAHRSLAEVRAAAAEAGVAACEVRGCGRDPVAEPWTVSPAARAARPARAAGRPPPVAGVPTAPLAGLHVVEITTRLQGPLAGLLLGLLGAEVIKIEPPGGDFGKRNPPRAGSLGAAYLAYNSGKRCVELDYKDGAGRRELLEHLRGADVFLHNWRHGRAEKLGLDPDALWRCNPRLVCAEAGGWGSAEPPPAGFATDCLVQAHTGCGDALNVVGQPPFPSLVPLTDVTGALLACVAALAGLLLRERDGAGRRARTSLVAAASCLQAGVGRLPPDPLHDPVETADGFLAVERGRVARPPADWRRRPARDWARDLLEAGIPAAVVAEDLATLPAEDAGGCRLPAVPWTFGR